MKQFINSKLENHSGEGSVAFRQEPSLLGISPKVAERPSFNLLEISSHLRKYGYPGRALRLIEKCGSPSNNFIMATCGCGTKAIELNHSCNKPFCPNCSKKRKRRIRRRLLPFLKYHKNNSLYQWRFLTISPKNYTDDFTYTKTFPKRKTKKGISPKCSITFKGYEAGKYHLRASFSKFIRKEYITSRIYGGFCVIEVTNKGKGWNLHAHSILYSRYLDNTYRGHCQHCGQNYLKWNKEKEKFYCANRKCAKLYEGIIRPPRIQKEFESSSGRPCQQIDISKVKSQSTLLNYVLKYISIVKESFTDIDNFAFYISKSYGDRQINAFGKFYNFKFQISQYSFLSSLFKCPKCGEVVKFSFDSEINKILRGDYEDPPYRKRSPY